MKFEFELTPRLYRKQLERKFRTTSYIYCAAFTLFYLLAGLQFIKNNFWFVTITFIIYLVVLFLVLQLVNKLFAYLTIKFNKNVIKNIYGKYQVEINDKFIEEKSSNGNIKIDRKEIKDIKLTKNRIDIIEDIKLTYYKEQIGQENFDKIKNELIKEHQIKK